MNKRERSDRIGKAVQTLAPAVGEYVGDKRTHLLLAAKANSTAMYDAIVEYNPCPATADCGHRGCQMMRKVLDKIRKEAGL